MISFSPEIILVGVVYGRVFVRKIELHMKSSDDVLIQNCQWAEIICISWGSSMEQP